jgi:hypothetical protein
MLHLLHRFCFSMWGLGFLGMWLTKGFKPVGEAPFVAATGCLLVGAGSLCFLLALDVLERLRHAR